MESTTPGSDQTDKDERVIKPRNDSDEAGDDR
jgi:hypothetical protein